MDGGFVKALLSQPHLPAPVYYYADADVEMIAKRVCACLNGSGGWIVVGVDDRRIVTGIPMSSFEEMVQECITSYVSPQPLVYVQSEVYEDVPVILITIPKGSLSPYTYKGRYYVIDGDEVVVPSPDKIALLLREPVALSSEWERMNNLYGSESDLDEQLMGEVYEKGLSLGRLSKLRGSLRSLLSELQLVRTGEVSNGAVALFAREIRHLLPQCRMRIQLMRKGKMADEYEDMQFIEGNIFEVQQKAIGYFRDRLPKVAYFFSDKTGRYNDFEYPIDVLDEAISNALIHRDYTDVADEITVFVYSDKIEITNSGEMPARMVSGKSRVLPHGSVLRNPLMAEIFYVAGEMEKTGRGLLLISNKMKEAGRKLPEWMSQNGKTTLRLYSRKDDSVENDRIRWFVSQKKKGDIFTKMDYALSFEKKLSKGTIQNDLLLMVKLGISEKVGNGPATKYILR